MLTFDILLDCMKHENAFWNFRAIGKGIFSSHRILSNYIPSYFIYFLFFLSYPYIVFQNFTGRPHHLDVSAFDPNTHPLPR